MKNTWKFQKSINVRSQIRAYGWEKFWKLINVRRTFIWNPKVHHSKIARTFKWDTMHLCSSKNILSTQETGCILRIGLALSKCPHFHSADLLAGAALGRVPRVPVNAWISRACTKEPLNNKIKCDSLEVVNPLIEIPNAAPY